MSDFWANMVPGLGTANEWAHTAAQMIYNSKEAEKNREWQEHMSNTAHQREVADLRKAGLNPILTATGGSGASSPVGGVASAGIGNSDVSSLVQARTQKRIGSRQEQNLEADTHVKQAQWSLVNEQDNNEFEKGLNLMKDRELTSATIAKTMQDIENSKVLTNAQVINLLEGAKFNKRRASGYSESKSSTKSYGAGLGPIKGNYNTADSYSKSW